jgi:hypothetical protein
MMQTIGSNDQDRNEKLPYLDLARALVADAMRHHDTRWLTSYTGTFCMDMIGYKPSIKVRIENVTANKKQSTKISHLWLWKGKTRSLAEIARMEGVMLRTLQNRLGGGWDLERAIKTPLKKDVARRFQWKGELRTLPEIAEDTGRDYNLLYNRVCSNGWSIEKAVDTPTGASGKRSLP